MSATLKIYCKNTGEYLPIHGGETLQEIANRLAPRLGTLQLICAAVNNKTEPLQYQLFGPKQVEFLEQEFPVRRTGLRPFTVHDALLCR